MLLAGVMAHLGFVDLAAAVAVGTLGALAEDLLVYGVGRFRADAVRASRLYRRVGPTVERLMRTFGVWQLVIARFIYGTNLLTTFLWGARALSLSLFLPLALAGCTIWASVLAGLGYAMSRSAAALIGEVQRGERWLFLALVSCAALSVTLRLMHRRHRLRAEVDSTDPGAGR